MADTGSIIEILNDSFGGNTADAKQSQAACFRELIRACPQPQLEELLFPMAVLNARRGPDGRFGECAIEFRERFDDGWMPLLYSAELLCAHVLPSLWDKKTSLAVNIAGRRLLQYMQMELPLQSGMEFRANHVFHRRPVFVQSVSGAPAPVNPSRVTPPFRMLKGWPSTDECISEKNREKGDGDDWHAWPQRFRECDAAVNLAGVLQAFFENNTAIEKPAVFLHILHGSQEPKYVRAAIQECDTAIAKLEQGPVAARTAPPMTSTALADALELDKTVFNRAGEWHDLFESYRNAGRNTAEIPLSELLAMTEIHFKRLHLPIPSSEGELAAMLKDPRRWRLKKLRSA